MGVQRRSTAIVGVAAAALVSTGLAVVGAAPPALARGESSLVSVGESFKGGYWAITVVGDRVWMTATDSRALVSVTMRNEAQVYRLPDSFPAGPSLGITAGPGGRVSFTETDNAAVSSVDANGGDAKRRTILKGSKPSSIATAADGALWYTVGSPDRISRLAQDGKVSDFFVGDKVGPVGISSNGTRGMVFAAHDRKALGLVDPAGKIELVPLPSPGGDPTDTAVGADGTVWVTRDSKDVVRVSPTGAPTVFATKSAPTAVAVAADGSAWWVSSSAAVIGRIGPDGSNEEFPLSVTGRDLVAGPDGNLWVATPVGGVAFVVDSGLALQSTKAPAVLVPGGSSLGTGTVLTSTDGSWNFVPHGLKRQWERCSTADAGGCADIAGATGETYTVTDADLGAYVRVRVMAFNDSRATRVPAVSVAVAVAATPGQPTTPTQPTGPAPVAGAVTVALTPGIVAKATSPSTIRRGTKRTYAVTFTSPKPRGTVRISLVDAAGTEVRVLAPATAVTGTKRAAYARKKARIPKAVPKGAYTLVFVYTPTAKQAATYPVATLTRGVTLR